MTAEDEPKPAGDVESSAPSREAIPAPEQRLPIRLSAMVICQDAFRDDRGRTHLHAVFDNLNANGFPVNAQFMVWCSVRGRGAERLVLKIMDTLEQTIAVTEPLITEVTPFKAHEFFFGFNVSLAGAGLYRVTAYVDGIPAMEVPLMVRHAPAVPPQQARA